MIVEKDTACMFLLDRGLARADGFADAGALKQRKRADFRFIHKSSERCTVQHTVTVKQPARQFQTNVLLFVLFIDTVH